MKRVVSVSLGSSKRNHAVEAEFLGEKFSIERIGTDGDLGLAISMIKEMDGKVDAFGMGGIDLYLVAGKRRYMLRDGRRIARAAKKTPIVDGSGLKNTLERRVIRYLSREAGMSFKGKRVLMVAGTDRFGMSEALAEEGAEITFGDLIFGLGIPIPIRSLRTLEMAAMCLAPLVAQLPFSMLYPTGKKQEEMVPRYSQYYHAADIIAGDFHYIKRHLPMKLEGQTIITNTLTAEDIEMLKNRGAGMVISTTPEMEGRSFGTNVLEGVLVVLSGKLPAQITEREYNELLDKMEIKPRIISFVSKSSKVSAP